MNTINKQALEKWIRTRKSALEQAIKLQTGYHLRHLNGQHSAFVDFEWEIQEGRFDSPSDDRLRAALVKAERFISNVMSFWGEGLEVVNWHQNGDAEPFDSILDSNMDGDELEVIRAALSTTTEPTGTGQVNEQLLAVFNHKYATDRYQAGILDALDILGIKVPGINMSDKEDTNDATP